MAMSSSDQAAAIEYRVFTATRPGLTPGVPPGYESLLWVANSATLIYGKQDAVLVDTVARHKIPDHDDDPRNIAGTRQHLRDFIRLDQETDSPRALFDAMIELYPDRANPGSLWGGANAAKNEAGSGSPSAVTATAQDEQS